MADGLSRRDMIKGAAVAGAAAWTAPMIIDSLTSPAAAASGGLPTTCSYALIVFTYNGAGPYIMKIAQGSASCTYDNSTSNDDTFTAYPCGSNTYQGGAGFGAAIQYSTGGPFANVPTLSSPTCDTLFLVQNTVITVRSGQPVTILAGFSHHGPSSGWQNTKWYPVCGNGSTSVTVNCG